MFFGKAMKSTSIVTMETKQKIFDQLYLLWHIQGWTYTSQNFTFLSQGSYVVLGGWAFPFGIQCSTKTLGIRKVEGTLNTFQRRF